MLDRVSLTGADDQVDPGHLVRMSREHPLVEWAILYFPEREGTPRNPSAAWRKQLIDQQPPRIAVHLFGEQVFRELLDRSRRVARLRDLARYDRIQLNVNARARLFSDMEVFTLYRMLLAGGFTVIAQYHEATQAIINELLLTVDSDERSRLHVLFDCSKGRGVLPDAWPSPLLIDSEPLYCGYAGGLGPSVLERQLPSIATAARRANYWIDMETGIRTDNQFDLDKVARVLQLAHRAVEPELVC